MSAGAARRRVLQVTPTPLAALRFVLPLARALEAAAYSVELVSGPGHGLSELERQGFRVHRLPISRELIGWRNLHAAGALRAIVRAGDFEVVHAHTASAGAVLRLAARGSPARVVYTLHDSLWGDDVSAWRRLSFTAMERALGRWTDLAFAVNPEDADDLVERARLPPERVRRMPAGGVGVAPEFFVDSDEREEQRHAVRARLGLSRGHRVLAYLGRTVAVKVMAELAEVFALLAWDEPSARLLVVGTSIEGERGASDRAGFLAAIGAAADRVLWPGLQDRVVHLLAAADALILPSHREGFGISLAEAAAVGLPAVATATRGARAAVLSGQTGLLVPVGDVEGLARAALRLLTDREAATGMGAAARRLAEERFTREAVLKTYLEGYRDWR